MVALTLQMLYHRLLTLKSIADEQLAENRGPNPPPPRINPLAVELGLSHTVPVIDDGPEAPARYYRYTLELCEKLFEGEIEQSAFEEACRLMYGIRAFPIFSVDKLISTVIKHAHVANGEPRSQELIALLERDRATEPQTVRQQIAYRMHAEAIVGPDEPLFRIERSADGRMLSIQLLGPDEPTLDEPLTPDQRWDTYRSSYALVTPTELVGAAVVAPILRRNLVAVADEHGLDDPHSGGPRDSAASVGGLHVRLARPSCRIGYEAGGEDVVARLAPPSPAVRDRTRTAGVRDAQRFDAWMGAHGLSSR